MPSYRAGVRVTLVTSGCRRGAPRPLPSAASARGARQSQESALLPMTVAWPVATSFDPERFEVALPRPRSASWSPYRQGMAPRGQSS